MLFTRRAALALPLVFAACADDSPAPDAFAPLRYDYLTPIGLNVASIEIEQHAAPGGRHDATARAPVDPARALGQMARDRLQALGPSGRAVFVITEASLSRNGDSYQGAMAVELDIDTSAGIRAGFAAARVSRRREDAEGDQRAILYDLTKQLMDAMNVEFEYQVRRSLKDYLISGTAPPPAPVQQQDLAPPS